MSISATVTALPQPVRLVPHASHAYGPWDRTGHSGSCQDTEGTLEGLNEDSSMEDCS